MSKGVAAGIKRVLERRLGRNLVDGVREDQINDAKNGEKVLRKEVSGGVSRTLQERAFLWSRGADRRGSVRHEKSLN